MKVIREEIFGPVVCATPFSDDDLDVIAKQRERHDLWPGGERVDGNGGTAHKLASRIRSGTVWINCHNVFDASLPFGGYKQSGWGREMGEEVFHNYTEVKAVTAGFVTAHTVRHRLTSGRTCTPAPHPGRRPRRVPHSLHGRHCDGLRTGEVAVRLDNRHGLRISIGVIAFAIEGTRRWPVTRQHGAHSARGAAVTAGPVRNRPSPTSADLTSGDVHYRMDRPAIRYTDRPAMTLPRMCKPPLRCTLRRRPPLRFVQRSACWALEKARKRRGLILNSAHATV